MQASSMVNDFSLGCPFNHSFCLQHSIITLDMMSITSNTFLAQHLSLLSYHSMLLAYFQYNTYHSCHIIFHLLTHHVAFINPTTTSQNLCFSAQCHNVCHFHRDIIASVIIILASFISPWHLLFQVSIWNCIVIFSTYPTFLITFIVLFTASSL